MAGGTVPGPAIGVDVGGTKLLAVRVGGSSLGGAAPHQAPSLGAASPVVEAAHQAPSPGARADLEAALAETLARLAPGGPGALGVGLPGLVDRDGELRFSPHRPGLVGARPAVWAERAAPGVAAWVGNDATAAVWAEHRLGVARGVDDVVMVTLGTGIGGGILAGGRLQHGAHRFAGEVGHMVVDPDGPACPCGKRGCWERLASGGGLAHLAREEARAGRAPAVLALAGGDPAAIRGEHVTAAAVAGDGAACALVGRVAWWLGLGLANLANTLDPALLVIGGGLAGAGDALLSPTRAAFAELVEGAGHRAVRIEAAALGPEAGAIGAALLAAEQGGG